MIPEPENGDPPPPVDVEGPAEKSETPSTELSPEEQMALYEEDLKENDWGHQPC